MSDVSAQAPAGAVPLGRHTTLRLGGPPERLVVATNSDETLESVRTTRGPLFVLAGGSNVVIGDEGVPGTVLLIRSRGVTITPDGRADGDPVLVEVAAGEPWDDVVAATVRQGLAGLECLSGIPGSAGATPIQNVGAYGQEVAETIAAVRVYDRLADEVRVLTPDECGFAYRTSVFKRSDRWVVLDVTFRLFRSPRSAAIRYAELARALGVPVGDRVPLADARDAVLRLRAGKGMLLDPTDPDTFSVGSFFTNPVLDEPAYQAMLARARDGARDGDRGEPPAWPGTDGLVKVSAAWLIERAGFAKGYGHPARGVALSTKHTLALTNRGDGTTAALLALAREIRDGVHDRFGVTLHPEPVLVGCEL